MANKLSFLILFLLFLTSCGATHNSMMNADSNMRKVKLDMTKQEVVAIMGETYLSVSSEKTPEGFKEVLGYRTAVQTDGIYMLSFIDNKLAEWHIEWPERPIYQPYPSSSGE
ncbi:hypothetical protein [Dysgonomonas sp. 520]|uniref:hypothetical protein n=1 Tax=Dysgonomonas sp. 520 TaxID=2302931 RepID=UPI0013D70641|nr:hypothetical protein [Dysgonomonas sp. 520]NDW10034.1 hypothetical protein [Dysgonomonas sp. 520]